MTYPRRVVPGTTYLLTRRCMHRRFTLVPRGVVPKLFGYCVALAAERHGVEVHAVTCMSRCSRPRVMQGAGIIEPNFGLANTLARNLPNSSSPLRSLHTDAPDPDGMRRPTSELGVILAPANKTCSEDGHKQGGQP